MALPEVRGRLPEGLRTVPQLIEGVAAYFTFYNLERPHQAFDYETPSDVYHQAA